jgi:hypothetical protein
LILRSEIKKEKHLLLDERSRGVGSSHGKEVGESNTHARNSKRGLHENPLVISIYT